MKSNFLKPTEMKHVSNRSVVDNILSQFQYAIATNRFKIGDKLPSEYKLMEELDVGRNSLREAIRVLTTMGVVEVKRGDGTYICKEINTNSMDFLIYSILLESSSPEEIIELRQVLDEDVLKLAIIHATEDDIQILEENIKHMRFHYHKGELNLSAKYDFDFHLHLAKCTKNKLFERIITGVYNVFESSIEKNILVEEQLADADKYHEEMLLCIKNRTTENLEEVVKQSLVSWSANVRL